VTEGDVAASYSNGVLELRVRKPEQPKPHRIPVSNGETAVSNGESGAIEGKARKKD
jgi:hypothetical protein